MTPVTTSQALCRGFFMKCPCCGEGRMLHRYTTPLPACSTCGQDFGVLRADDGPAWLTILVTGHMMVPFMFLVLESGIESMWMMIAILIALALAFSAVILPRAKGVFMAIIWVTRVRRAA